MKYQKINVSICLKYRLSKIHENIHYGFKKQTKVLRLKKSVQERSTVGAEKGK